MYWFDNYSAGISLLCSALFEAIAVTYCYGLERFCDDIESMIGSRPSIYWKICWKYISPLFLIVGFFTFSLFVGFPFFLFSLFIYFSLSPRFWESIKNLSSQTVITLIVISTEDLTFHEYTFPLWATVMGWTLSLSSVSAVPIVAIIFLVRQLIASTKPPTNGKNFCWYNFCWCVWCLKHVSFQKTQLQMITMRSQQISRII